jgi:hypothetical protein
MVTVPCADDTRITRTRGPWPKLGVAFYTVCELGY